jgi:hypothetical protein
MVGKYWLKIRGIYQVESLPRRRRRRLTDFGWSFSPGGDPEAELASEAALRLFRERSTARYETWRRTRGMYPPQWREASEDSEYLFYLTAEEMAQLGRELTDVLMRWRQPQLALALALPVAVAMIQASTSASSCQAS